MLSSLTPGADSVSCGDDMGARREGKSGMHRYFAYISLSPFLEGWLRGASHGCSMSLEGLP